jgi:hypothetical protein
MLALWTRRAFGFLKALTSFKQWSSIVLPCLVLLAFNSVAFAQGGASPVTKSFDFRNGSLGWEAGFSDYPPATDKDGFYELKAEIRSLPPELGVSGTGFYIQGNNHSDDLFMFLNAVLILPMASSPDRHTKSPSRSSLPRVCQAAALELAVRRAKASS